MKGASLRRIWLYGKSVTIFCSAKVVMSAFSQVKMSSFVGVDLDEGVNQFEP